MAKIFTLEFNKKPIEFVTPDDLTIDAVIENIRGIRIGHYREWSRPFLKTLIASTEIKSYDAKTKMKYIIMSKNLNDTKLSDEEIINSATMIIFDKIIDHDRMHEMLMGMIYDSNDNREILNDTIHSAGFLDIGNVCCGHSETLGVKSKPIDQKIFNKLFAAK